MDRVGSAGRGGHDHVPRRDAAAAARRGRYDSSLTTDEITEFRRSGRPAPDVAFAASLEACGLPTNFSFIETWTGFDAATILGAIDRGFTSGEQFAPWTDTDADVTEAAQLAAVPSGKVEPAKVLEHLRAGRTPAEIAYADEAGIRVKKVPDWIERGLSAQAAASWSSAGFSASSVAAWAEVVADPAVASLLESVGFDVDTARGSAPTRAGRRTSFGAASPSMWEPPRETADDWAATTWPIASWRSGSRAGSAVGRCRLVAARRPADRGGALVGRRVLARRADAWRGTGVDPDIAARRRDAGVRPATPD